MEDVAELQRKLRVAEEEAESAKENLRVERAKMTREKKQWALDRKSEEKRWAEDMAQLSREKRIWAEERERLTASSAESGKSKWEQERRSLLEQHRIEIAALQAHKDSPHVGESGKCEKLAAEQARADDLERQLHLERVDAKVVHAYQQRRREVLRRGILIQPPNVLRRHVLVHKIAVDRARDGAWKLDQAKGLAHHVRHAVDHARRVHVHVLCVLR